MYMGVHKLQERAHGLRVQRINAAFATLLDMDKPAILKSPEVV